MEGMKRTETTVLPDSSLVPSDCLIVPVPNQFTHEVTRPQPFFASHGTPSGPPQGDFAAATKVALLVYDGGEMCRVVDGNGHYVDTRFDGLRKL
jgi:hypothetical protein